MGKVASSLCGPRIVSDTVSESRRSSISSSSSSDSSNGDLSGRESPTSRSPRPRSASLDSADSKLSQLEIPLDAPAGKPLPQLPDEVWQRVAEFLERKDWESYRQVSKTAALNAAVPVKSVEVLRREDLIPAIRAFANGGLTTVEAFGCEITDEDIALLAQELAATPSITSLNLRNNRVGDAGARALAAVTSLTSLDLRDNLLGQAGQAALQAVRDRFQSLRLGDTTPNLDMQFFLQGNRPPRPPGAGTPF